MGNKISRWAERQLPQLRSTGEKLVLMVLAVDAEADGQCALDTSISEIATRCDISRTAAKAALSRLRDKKLIEVEQRLREDGGNDNSSYRLALSPRAESDPGVGRNPTYPPVGIRPSPRSKNATLGQNPTQGLTCGNADPRAESDPATSSLHPSDVVVPRTSATHAHTPARVHDAPAREQPPHQNTHRREALNDLNATATRTETRSLIAAWRAGHAEPVTDRLVTQMTAEVDRAVRAGRDAECLAAALREWNCRPNLFSPKILAGLYDDAVSRKNAGESPDRPLIDENGMPRIHPQQIPDSHLTSSVVDAVLGGRDTIQPPPYPPDDQAYGPDGTGYDQAGLDQRREFFTTWSAERLVARRAEVRHVLIRAWNRKHQAAAS